MLKETMYRNIDSMKPELTAMADDLFDHPEIGLEEFHALKLLTDWLEREGFQVERGVAALKPPLRLSTSTEQAAPTSVCSASTTRFRGWAMPAAIICRGPASWPPPRP